MTNEDNENKSKYIEFINYIIGILAMAKLRKCNFG